MANTNNSTPAFADLATRLIDHADSITNAACHEMETDLRTAARALLGIERPTPRALLPALHAELERAAASTSDDVTRRHLCELIGAGGAGL